MKFYKKWNFTKNEILAKNWKFDKKMKFRHQNEILAKKVAFGKHDQNGPSFLDVSLNFPTKGYCIWLT